MYNITIPPRHTRTTLPHTLLLSGIITFCLMLISCQEEGAPQAEPAIDVKARKFLTILTTQDLAEIRKPLNDIGRRSVDNISMATTFSYFNSGTPHTVILIDAETAVSEKPTYAERHRLTYTLECSDDNRYYYFFEATVENGDTLISGFMIEPRKK